MDEEESGASYPWDKTAEATLEQRPVNVVVCGDCEHSWPPRVERPKFCPECKSELQYADELQEEPEESGDSDEDGEEVTDLEQLLNQEDSE